MKILILSQYWWPENGVPQRRWSWLTKLLVDAGHEVSVIAPPPHYNRSFSFSDFRQSLQIRDKVEIGPSGERIHRSAYLPATNSLTARALNQGVVAAGMVLRSLAQKAGKPDVIIGTVPALPTAAATQMIAKCLKAPYILDLRDAWPELLHEKDSWNEGTGNKSLREKALSKGPAQLVAAVVERALWHSYYSSNGMMFTAVFLEKKVKAQVEDKNQKPLPTRTVRNLFPAETIYWSTGKEVRPLGELKVLYAGTLGRAQKLSNAIEAASIANEAGVKVSLRFVGAGATSAALREESRRLDVDIEFYGQVDASELAEHYEWCDTALVHLTAWEPLKAAIPSKTFELMQSGIHISGVVEGETASLISDLNAGAVVPPENPSALAELWIDLANNREPLKNLGTAKEWVENQRDIESAKSLLGLLGEVING